MMLEPRPPGDRPRPPGDRPRLLGPEDEQAARRVLARCGLRGPDLEDSVQDIRLRLLRFAPPEQELRPWVARVAHNVAIDHHRAVRRRRNLMSRMAASAPAAAPAPDPTARLAVAWGLRRLQPEHREVLALRFLAGLPVGEIAAVLDVPEGTVKSRLHRASAALRRTLDDGRELSWTA